MGAGVLVPTMGALHAGHESLIARARAVADERRSPVVVTVFVNPTQFNESADFERYPRTLDADTAIAERGGADAVYAPDVREVYPDGPAEWAGELPRVATAPGLEDRHRPGHFAGVCQVVSRLFELAAPQAAVFGEKDWQQLQVVRAMAGAQHRVEVLSAPTVRDKDGLALSSRNRFLSDEERAEALAIPRALGALSPADNAPVLERMLRRGLLGAAIEVEYAVVRDAETLEAPRRGRPRRALVAARVGMVRLIDNQDVGVWEEPTDQAGA